jgi:RND family efflux transporter MFP subunit
VPVYEYEMPLVKTGDNIEVEVPAITGKKMNGVIRSIDPVLDPMTRSVRVRAVLENPDGVLKPEMYVNATLQANLGEVLVVPQEAVFATGDKNVIFVAKKGGLFEPREVKVGAVSEGVEEIKSGLSEGETVVVSGNFLIDSESRLKGALEGMGGGGHQHGQ